MGNVNLLLACAIRTRAHGQPVSIAIGSKLKRFKNNRINGSGISRGSLVIALADERIQPVFSATQSA